MSVVTRIEPRRPSWRTVARELIAYRDLLRVLVRRDFVAVYKQTVLGPAWYVLQPLATTVVFTLIFGRVAALGTDGAPDFLFYMAGSVLWSWAQASFTNISNALTVHAHLLSKVYFPRLVLPIAAGIAALAQLALNVFLLLLSIAWVRGPGGAALPASGRAWGPLAAVVLAGVTVFGAGLWVASLTAKYRDLKFGLPFLIQLWMFLSPVVWPLSRVPATYRPWLALNPLVMPFELWRRGWLGVGTWDGRLLIANLALACGLLASGLWLFRRVEGTLADVV